MILCPVISQLAVEVGIARAKFDLSTTGHFNNRYRIGTSEHEGYEAFAAPIRARIHRRRHATPQHQT
jgi:hypothetical protein